jgi:hypothetical protein
MGQEFIIKSQALEDKINQLLPSQGGFQAGVDLSASTTVIPIIDLTESAEGSGVRADLQTALSFKQITSHTVSSTTSTIINTTGYFRVFGYNNIQTSTSAARAVSFTLNDGTTNKIVFNTVSDTTTAVITKSIPLDFIVFLSAGDLLKVTAGANCAFNGCSRQIADISGNLVNPT